MTCILDQRKTSIFMHTAPYSPPLNLSGVVLDSTSITLRWLPPPSDLFNGNLRYYHVMISDPYQETVHESLVYSDSLEVTVGELHPHYVYECSVTAVTVDEGPSASLQLQMLEDSKFAQYKYSIFF